MARVGLEDEEAPVDCEGGEVMLLTELHEPRIGHVGAHLDSFSRFPELSRVLGGRVILLVVLVLIGNLLSYLLRLGGSWLLASLGLAF